MIAHDLDEEMLMPVTFWVALAGEKYDRELGWPCSALGVPGATVEEFRLDGRTIPLEQIASDQHNLRLVAAPDDQVPDAAAKIRLEKRLVTIDSALVASILALIGTLGAAYISAGALSKNEAIAGDAPFELRAGGVHGTSGPSLYFPGLVKAASLDVTSGIGIIKDKNEPRVDGNAVHVSVVPKPGQDQEVYDYTLKVWLKQ